MLTNKQIYKTKIIQHDIFMAQQSNLQEHSLSAVQALVIQHTPAHYLKKQTLKHVIYTSINFMVINLPTGSTIEGA